MARTWIFAVPLVTGLVGACAMDNPLFDPNANSGGETTMGGTGSEEASASMSGGESASDSNSAGTDSDSNTTTDSTSDTNTGPETDTDPTEPTEPTDSQSGEPDMMEQCIPEIRGGLRPFVGSWDDFDGQECIPVLENNYFEVFGTQGENLLAQVCNGGGCGECFGPIVQIGLGGGNPALAASIEAGTEQEPICYVIDADPIVDDFDECVYGSMNISGIPEGGEAYVILFHANREGWWPEGELWNDQVSGWEPLDIVPQLGEDCECDPNLQLDCCPGDIVLPHKFLIDEQQTSVYPGDWSDSFLIPGNDTFSFYAAQAQTGVSCDADIENSWALRRD